MFAKAQKLIILSDQRAAAADRLNQANQSYQDADRRYWDAQKEFADEFGLGNGTDEGLLNVARAVVQTTPIVLVVADTHAQYRDWADRHRNERSKCVHTRSDLYGYTLEGVVVLGIGPLSQDHSILLIREAFARGMTVRKEVSA